MAAGEVSKLPFPHKASLKTSVQSHNRIQQTIDAQVKSQPFAFVPVKGQMRSDPFQIQGETSASQGNTLNATPISFSEIVQGPTRSHSARNSQPFIDPLFFDLDLHTLKDIDTFEGKPSVIFNSCDKDQLIAKLKLVLVGKFSHGRPPLATIKEAFDSLHLKGDLNISIYDRKHIFIECSCVHDFYRIWMKIVWFIKGYAMRVFKWGSDFSPSSESSIAPVWIRIEGLPLYLFDELSLLSIAKSIGKPICVDSRNVNRTKLNSARICVELDVAKPLPDSIWICFKDVNPKAPLVGFWVKVFFDVVPHYCSGCLHIGHCQGDCKRGSGTAGRRVEVVVQTGDRKQIVKYTTAKNVVETVVNSVSDNLVQLKIDHAPLTVRSNLSSRVWQPKARGFGDAAHSVKPQNEHRIWHSVGNSKGLDGKGLDDHNTAIVLATPNRFSSLESVQADLGSNHKQIGANVELEVPSSTSDICCLVDDNSDHASKAVNIEAQDQISQDILVLSMTEKPESIPKKQVFDGHSQHVIKTDLHMEGIETVGCFSLITADSIKQQPGQVPSSDTQSTELVVGTVLLDIIQPFKHGRITSILSAKEQDQIEQPETSTQQFNFGLKASSVDFKAHVVDLQQSDLPQMLVIPDCKVAEAVKKDRAVQSEDHVRDHYEASTSMLQVTSQQIRVTTEEGELSKIENNMNTPCSRLELQQVEKLKLQLPNKEGKHVNVDKQTLKYDDTTLSRDIEAQVAEKISSSASKIGLDPNADSFIPLKSGQKHQDYKVKDQDIPSFHEGGKSSLAHMSTAQIRMYTHMQSLEMENELKSLYSESGLLFGYSKPNLAQTKAKVDILDRYLNSTCYSDENYPGLQDFDDSTQYEEVNASDLCEYDEEILPRGGSVDEYEYERKKKKNKSTQKSTPRFYLPQPSLKIRPRNIYR